MVVHTRPRAQRAPTPSSIQRTYFVLILGNTMAASLIWGINTIFLLDAGLSNLQAFSANAFYTAGMVLFEVPTGVVADTVGRRASYLLGTVTLSASTLLYVLLWWIGAPFWQWAIVSILIGLGYTFFSGAVEAWLVDALTATGYSGDMEAVFGRGQIVSGIAMLAGSVAGGFIAAQTSIGIPFVLRGLILVLMFGVAMRLMHDIGFTPDKGNRPVAEMRKIALATIDHGWRVPAVRWLMVESLFTGGVGVYGFYALQPYLLELYGDPQAYQVAGLVAAIVAGAQILGGSVAPRLRRLFHRRTTALIWMMSLNVITLGLIGVLRSLWAVIALIVVWGLLFAATMPIRQTYINGLIPSRQRATILSFDSLMSSAGGVWAQPALGRVADVWGYAPSYLAGAAVSALALPFLALSRRQNAAADTVAVTGAAPPDWDRPVAAGDHDASAQHHGAAGVRPEHAVRCAAGS
ncbi:MAG TPA: MFS transporter [Euzebyales bacterium]|nr:MFS transporter [Euzebyales bacterium]